jgi:hypothetical protein
MFSPLLHSPSFTTTGLSTGYHARGARRAKWCAAACAALSIVLIAGDANAAAVQKADNGEKPRAALLVIQPASASLAGGRAQLTASTLKRRGGTYVGSYRLKVTPYFYKSENGTLSIAVPESSLDRLLQGSPEEFTGRVVTSGTSQERRVAVRATGNGTGKGNLKISVMTENGELVFNTSYRIAEE